MQKVTLQFQSAYDLWKYKQVCKLRNIEVNFNTYTLNGNFGQEDIDLAVKDYKAKVLANA